MSIPLIVEMDAGGHRLVYLRLLVEFLNARGVRPVLGLGPGVRDTSEYQTHLGNSDLRFGTYDLTSAPSGAELLRITQEHVLQHVVIPDGENHLKLLLTRRSQRPNVTALIMQDPKLDRSPIFRRRLKMRVKQTILTLADSRRGTRLLYLRGPGFRSPATDYVNDPVLVNIDAHYREYLTSLLKNKASNRFWFCLVGVMSPRKNPLIVARALRMSGLRDVGLLIAGPSTDQAEDELHEAELECQEAGIELVRIAKHLTNEEMNAVVDIADCVVVAYATHAPPSTLGKAAALGTHLIIAGSKELRSHAQVLLNAHESEMTCEAIARSMRAAYDAQTPPALAVFEDDVFAARLTELT